MTAVFAEEFFVDCYTPVKYIFIYINKENINTRGVKKIVLKQCIPQEILNIFALF